jgi:serine protease Do
MNCVCGHRENDHVRHGRCRVPDCPCQMFQPGDTLTHAARWRRDRRWRVIVVLVASVLACPAAASAAEVAPPGSFAAVARAARAASIVIRAVDVDETPTSVPMTGASHDGMDLEEDSSWAPGIIVDPRGFAVTSARAVLQSRAFEVALVDGTPVDAILLGIDRRSDVAVLKLQEGMAAWPFMPLGASDRVAAGEWVIAITAPLGLEGTVTAGVITASPRPADLDFLAGFLQTDAALGAGSAGAPLISLDGRVIGLGVGFRAKGIGYARPSNLVRKVYLELVERGRVIRPWLGVSTQALTARLARALGVRGVTGVLIADVAPGGPGARAGLRSGDVVVAIDATPVSSRAQLKRAMGGLVPGRTVTLNVRRAAATVSVRVKLGEQPDDSQLPAPVARAKELLGIEAAPLTPTMGVVAADVEIAGPAHRAGVEPGDILREVNRRPLRAMGDFEAVMRSLDQNALVLILVQRADVTVYVAVDPRR